MNNLFVVFLFLIHLACTTPSVNSSPDQISNEIKVSNSNGIDSIPGHVQKLMACYTSVVGFSNNFLLFEDGSSLRYDDQKVKTELELLNDPDIEDMFNYDYRSWKNEVIPTYYDPGRIRVDSFFMKIYGTTKSQVQKKLVKVNWCPKLVNQGILVTSVNNVHLKIDSISRELDNMPHLKEYLQNIGGTFNWRQISGTKRMSMHSFGMTVDINTKFSNYWQWDCHCKNEEAMLLYQNRIPLEIVSVFEKYGFIWGGNWYHYDTMHFEYRPELL